MKKSGLALAVALILAAGTGSAGTTKYKVAVWGGFGTASGGVLNDMLDFFDTAGWDVTKVSTAIPFGIEGTYEVIDNLAVGLRLGLIMANQGKASIDAPPLASMDMKYTASAVPVMVGGRYSVPIDGKLSVSGGLFAGIASVNLKSEMESTILGFSTEKSSSDGATGVAAEVLLGATYKLAANWALGLDVGYRLVSVKAEAADLINNTVKEDTVDLNGVSGLLSVAYLF